MPSSPLFLSPSQVPLWFGQRLHPDRPHYNTAFSFVIDGELAISKLKNAWQLVLEDQPVLRSSFALRGERPSRVLLPSGEGAATVEHFREAEDPCTAFLDWAEKRARIPLSLEGALVDCVWAPLSETATGWYLNLHHLLTDAVSTELLFRAVGNAYACLETGRAVTRADLGLADPVSLEDLSAALPEEATAYWSDQFSRLRPIPFYGQSREPLDTVTVRCPVSFSPAAAERFAAICQSEGFRSLFPEVSLFTGWATVLSAWLHRVSGEAEIGFLAPARNRPASHRRALGAFMEMFPFVTEVGSRESFRELGRRCARRTRDLLVHAGPGHSATTETGAATNVVLNMFSSNLSRFAGRPCVARWLHPGHVDAVRPVRLQVFDLSGTGAYEVALDLNSECFSADGKARAVAHFEATLAAFLENPDVALGAVDILTPIERTQQLEDFNQPSRAPLPDRTVIDLFREQVPRTPERIALQEGSRSCTFSELAAGVDRWAFSLASASSDGPVAVWLPRSIEAVTCILGILASGRPYIPIDAGYPDARVRQILETGEAALVLTNADLAGKIANGSWTVQTIEGLPDEPSDSIPGPSMADPAYIIFTSGSTGRPKGVPITHAGLADYLTWAERVYVRGEVLSFALFTSLGFDLTVTSLFLPLLTGGTLHIYRDREGPVDGAFLAMMEGNVAELIKLTPSHLKLMRQYDLTRSRVRRMILGGEDLNAELAGTIHRLLGGKVELYNEYGPTEAVVGCMIHSFDPEADSLRSSVPIGRPADHVRLYVVNDSGQLVPTGVPGELCISRHGLTDGYIGEATLNSERFIPNPWFPGDRLYRTGDAVRFLTPETLDYLGRIDRQVKIAGYRIELREIEQALASYPSVSQVAVLLDQPSGNSITENSIAHRCVRCGLPSNYPGATFDAESVCHLCRSYETIEKTAKAWFRPPDEFLSRMVAHRADNASDYDCLHLLSGGKDSTYSLCRMVDMGLRVYAFTLDNGYISEEAKGNIRRVVDALGVPHEFGTTPAMNEIFRDSLHTFSNVCQGCFKTIYTLAINRAREMRIPFIVTGLSRGQFFETRLTPDLFRGGRFASDAVDRATLAARKVYHRIDDAVRRNLDVRAFDDDRVFEEVEVIDFYRYHDVSLTELNAYLSRRVSWVRPSDTGRSTNCLINDVGIYIHQRERGFHNYALPYSWDVRMGHKTREEAIDELDDAIDVTGVRRILREIDYDENRLLGQGQQAQLVACFQADEFIEPEALREHLEARLPRAMVPTRWVAVGEWPLTSNGKLDTASLLAQAHRGETDGRAFIPPSGPVEERVAETWQAVLQCGPISADDNFFSLGGTSLAAMEVTIQLCREFDLTIELPAIFQAPSIAALAQMIEAQLRAEIDAMSEAEAAQLLTEESGDE